MKLRIRGNSIRLRLTQSEVTDLAELGFVKEVTTFSNNQQLVYAVKKSDETESVIADFQSGQIEVIIPNHIASNWAETNEISILGNSDSLNILVEKDFKCLKPKENEDESDNFPHPKEKMISC